MEVDGDMVTSLVLSGNPSTTGRKKVESKRRKARKEEDTLLSCGR